MKQVIAGIKSFSLAVVASLTFVACDGHTTKSMCTDATGPIEGLTGVYDFNSRDQETFGIHVSKLRIVPDEKGTVEVKSVGDNDENLNINICNINGAYVLEVQRKNLDTFSPSRLYVSQAGIHISGLLFDKVALDNAKIPNKLVAVPEFVQTLVGSAVSHKIETVIQTVLESVADSQNILVDNTNVSAAKLLDTTKPSSVGFTWFRK